MSESRTFKAALLGSGKFLRALTELATAVILTRILTKPDYAAYMQTFLTYRFVAPFLSLGLPMALYYFLPLDQEHRQSVLSGNLLLLFCMGFLFLGFMWCGGNSLIAKRFDNPILSKLLLIFGPYAIFVLPTRAINACLVSCNRIKTLTVFNVASRLLAFAFIVCLALFLLSPYGPVIGAVAAAFLLFFPAIFLMYRAVRGNNWLPDKNNMWAQLKYSVPLGLASTIGTISINLDKVLVSAMCASEDFAVYVNGAMEIPLIGVITGSVMSILIPEFAVMYQRKNNKEILALWHRAMVKCALLILPIMVFLFIMAPEVMRLLFSAKYTDSAMPFRIYLLLLPVRITQFGSIFMASNRNSLIVYRSAIGLVFNFILSVVMIRTVGYIGAAIATVLVIYMWGTPYNLFFIGKILNEGISNILPYRLLTNIFLMNILAAFVLILKVGLDMSDLIKLVSLGCLYVLAIGLLYWSNRWIYIKNGKLASI